MTVDVIYYLSSCLKDNRTIMKQISNFQPHVKRVRIPIPNSKFHELSISMAYRNALTDSITNNYNISMIIEPGFQTKPIMNTISIPDEQWNVIVFNGDVVMCNDMNVKQPQSITEISCVSNVSGYMIKQQYVKTMLQSVNTSISLLSACDVKEKRYFMQEYWKPLCKHQWFVLNLDNNITNVSSCTHTPKAEQSRTTPTETITRLEYEKRLKKYTKLLEESYDKSKPNKNETATQRFELYKKKLTLRYNISDDVIQMNAGDDDDIAIYERGMNGFYINLTKRNDRDIHIRQNIISKYSLFANVRRFTAIYDTRKGLGCTLSHIGCLESLQKQNNQHEYYIIMEDDISIKPHIFNKFLKDFQVIKKSESWDVILLGGSYVKMKPARDKQFCNFKKVVTSQTTVGYIFKKRYIPTLLNNFKHSCQKLRDTKYYQKWAIDVGWRELQVKDAWYIYSDKFCEQIVSYSDIEEKISDYKDSYNNRQECKT